MTKCLSKTYDERVLYTWDDFTPRRKRGSSTREQDEGLCEVLHRTDYFPEKFDRAAYTTDFMYPKESNLMETDLVILVAKPQVLLGQSNDVETVDLKMQSHICQTVEVHHLAAATICLLRVFENKVLRKVFEAKRDEVTGEWRKLHNAELHALYSSPDIIRNIKFRRLKWAGHVARMGESRNAYRVLVGGPEGKRPLGRPRRRWEDNIKMDLREVGYDDREWINLAQDRDQWRAYVRAAMNLRVP
ncbi:hypothetical protein ANN_13607 [Periplaneta americana]|uniref:Uncharacterized protein n=1 Tax=Periplaneta americana TaxID=6978 RepID=A0ABQ8TJV5_PERAM|nr:hypothetical protein ANN_13607 [Periplaneta americana]